jgi:histidinol phosphatase-like enzyme
MKTLKIGLDIDGVIADFTLAWHRLYPEVNPTPNTWYLDPKIGDRFKAMREADTLDEFYLNIPTLINPKEIPFDPCCYITSRPVSREITEEWLKRNGFPPKKVFGVGLRMSKVEAAKEAGVEIFVDDHYENFNELNGAGITTYLFTASWNIMYDVGHMRLNSLKDILLVHH